MNNTTESPRRSGGSQRAGVGQDRDAMEARMAAGEAEERRLDRPQKAHRRAIGTTAHGAPKDHILS